jgi:pyruvate dehydrogenase E2 component (dihydrolipoamide acetyltransferase)
MQRVFVLPDPGEGLEEAEVVEWLVAEGDAVELNQPFVEVETAKAAVEIPSPYAGRVVALHAAEGDVVRVGAPLITFEVDEAGAGDAASADRVVDAGGLGPSGPSGASAASGRSEARSARPSPPAARAAPAVRRLARDLGIDIATVAPTGPAGRVTAEDVARAAGAGVPAEVVPAAEGAREVAVTPVRRAIAANLSRQAAIPQVTTFRTVDCTALEAVRAELGVSPLAVVVVALARTVADHPMLNATWVGDRILVHPTVNVGIAVDADRGLLVPVLRDAGALGVAAVAQAIRRLAEGARSDTLRPDGYTGATIAVSNTGSYGSEAGTPILAPGTAFTLALGVISSRALVSPDGRVEARPACTLSATFDHRVLDGADAGRALGDLVDLLQDDARLRDLPG